MEPLGNPGRFKLPQKAHGRVLRLFPAQCRRSPATLKTELIQRQPWPTRRATKDAVADYIEGTYNPY